MAGQIPVKGVQPKSTTPPAKKAPAKKAPGKAVAKVTKAVEKSDFTPAQAKKLTEKISKNAETQAEDIIKAYTGRIWLTKGYEYKSWDEYVDKEHDGIAIPLPREKKKEALQSLAAAGLSSRAIAAATGVSHTTAQRARREATVTNPAPAAPGTNVPPVIDVPPEDITEVPEGQDGTGEFVGQGSQPVDAPTPTTVQGQDGKTYTVPPPSAPKEPVVVNIVSVARTLAKDLDNVRIRLDSLFSREDYDANKVAVQGTLEQAVGDFIDSIVEEFEDLVRDRTPEGEPEPAV